MMETQKKKEIAIKKSPKAVALEKVPDETIAMAIRDALNKDSDCEADFGQEDPFSELVQYGDEPCIYATPDLILRWVKDGKHTGQTVLTKMIPEDMTSSGTVGKRLSSSEGTHDSVKRMLSVRQHRTWWASLHLKMAKSLEWLEQAWTALSCGRSA